MLIRLATTHYEVDQTQALRRHYQQKLQMYHANQLRLWLVKLFYNKMCSSNWTTRRGEVQQDEETKKYLNKRHSLYIIIIIWNVAVNIQLHPYECHRDRATCVVFCVMPRA